MAILKIESEVVGKVWKVLGQPGQSVRKGETILILESMKMEIPVDAPSAGKVASVEVAEEDVVEEGQVIVTIET